MKRPRSLQALCLAATVGACGGPPPPPELSGLWSAGDAACSAGVGVRFDNEAIAAIYDRQRETLFDHPRYEIEAAGVDFRVRVHYELPRHPGGARIVGAEGVLVLVRGAGGALEVASHNLLDARTGAARVRIVNDPAVQVLQLKPCGDHPWREGLRGRREA